MVLKQVENTILKHNLIKEGQHIVLGISGGPDSVCLFHCLIMLKDKYNWNIHPVHVNHKMRPVEAEKDQNYTVDLCKRFGLECKVYTEDCIALAKELGISSEEAGRKVRYEAFSNCCDKLEKKGIPRDMIVTAVAQNRDDRAETLLFRILRGTGTEGLASISYERDDEKGRKIIRPLMDVYRVDIENYTETNELDPVIDATNLEPLYSRNKIRLGLIPYIEENFNPNIKETLNRLADVAQEDKDYFRREGERVLQNITEEKSEEYIRVDLNALKKEDPAIRQRVMSKAMFQLGLKENLTYSHYQMTEDIILSNSPSGFVNLPEGYSISREYHSLIYSAPEHKSEESTLEIKKTVMDIDDFNKLGLRDKTYVALDYDLLKAEKGLDVINHISIRKREPGDYMKISENSTKKIKKMLIDMKIPKFRRDSVNLLSVGKEILCLRYENVMRFSYNFKINTNTKTVICIEFIKSTC